MGTSDQRKAPRYRIRIKVRYFNDEGLEGTAYTTDISTLGIAFDSFEGVKRGMRLHLEFFLPDGPFLAEGKVLRINQDDKHSSLGIQLLNFFDEIPGAGATRGGKYE